MKSNFLSIKKGGIEFIVSFIVAIVCLFVLIYLAIGIYGNTTTNNENKIAESNLDNILSKLSAIKQNEASNYLITGPVGWNLVLYDKKDLQEVVYSDVPSDCTEEYCLCFCKKEYSDISSDTREFFFYFRDQEKSNGVAVCENEGICKNIVGDYNLISIESVIGSSSAFLNGYNWIPIKKPTTISIIKDENDNIEILENL